ncbi:ABC transporter substrate-binding protein [Sporanaerobium hydrogeniformans]|uniref:ABC transporter substrate-binding protein n=1 Tax=Sporanaerobium hydrogeniformans TaxID=3072179 RepID=A0AC61DBH8_9FIRM|nr:sugar ABC transporter substrate-binding protein [Sporanaerobium hydrogeniformans]PHV69892.1 ABC transporter substrate-binding protein [Sporanaerobium hydrogeniformans]
MKKVLAALLAGGLVLSTVGCGGSSKSEVVATPDQSAPVAAAEENKKEPVTIKHWYWADNTEYSAVMQDIVKKFNETNESGITVVAEEYPWDGGGYSNTLFSAAMGGGGPDTASWKLTSTPLFTANNLLANLDDYIANWDQKDDIDQNLYDIMKQAGGTENIHVMPWNTQILYVYYRPSMFEEVGIEVPKTYEEFLTACEKLTRDTDGDGKTDVYGFGMRGAKGGQEPWGSFIHGRGGNFEDMTSPESVAGMQDFIDLYQKGYVPPTAPTDGFNEIIANFKSGRTAMTIHHTGSSAGMIETFGEDVSAFPFPAGKGQWTSMGDTENVIFESCKNKDAAFEWVAYLATGEGQKIWCEATGNVPVSKTVQALDFYQNNKFMKASIEGMSYAGILPILDTTTEWISVTWPNTVGFALTGEMTAEETMKVLQEELYK